MLGLVLAVVAASQEIHVDRREVTCREIQRVLSMHVGVESIPYANPGAIENDPCNWERDAAAAWESVAIETYRDGSQYRLAIKPSVFRPQSYVLSVDREGSRGILAAIFLQLTATEIGYYGLQEQPNFLILQRQLSAETAQELLILFQNTTICGPNGEPANGYDGEDWNFEVIGPERRCYEHFWNPQEGPNFEFGMRLIELGDDLLDRYIENEVE